MREMFGINEKTICGSRQNHPALVVEDARTELNLNDDQCEKLRFILMNRGVNKWLYCRLLFIQLKHDVKKKLRNSEVGSAEFRVYQDMNIAMQNIAKTPRWVEWGKRAHHNMKNNMREIKIYGKHM